MHLIWKTPLNRVWMTPKPKLPTIEPGHSRCASIAINWTGLKASFLEIAHFYDMLARQMEQAGANRLAQRPEDTSPNSSDKPKP
jgi:hypothetical protein